MTPEQEATYEKPLEEFPATPTWINSNRDTLYRGSFDEADKETVEVSIVTPNPQAEAIMSHMCGDTPDQFASVIGTLLAPEIQDKSLVPRVPTKDLHAPKAQITDALRPITTSDPYLPSVHMTPNKLAVVPRQRSTAQLPPHMRLHEDISDSPEDLIPVETLINAAILAFRNAQGRLPHKIIIAAIRYWRYRISINTFNPDVFYYDCAPIPITHAPIGDIGIDEVRLD